MLFVIFREKKKKKKRNLHCNLNHFVQLPTMVVRGSVVVAGEVVVVFWTV